MTTNLLPQLPHGYRTETSTLFTLIVMRSILRHRDVLSSLLTFLLEWLFMRPSSATLSIWIYGSTLKVSSNNLLATNLVGEIDNYH